MSKENTSKPSSKKAERDVWEKIIRFWTLSRLKCVNNYGSSYQKFRPEDIVANSRHTVELLEDIMIDY